MDEGIPRDLLRVVCRYRVVDPAILRFVAEVDHAEAMKLIGALLGSGYLARARRGSAACGSCPLAVACASRGEPDNAYVPTDKLRRLCESIVPE